MLPQCPLSGLLASGDGGGGLHLGSWPPLDHVSWGISDLFLLLRSEPRRPLRL